MTADTTGTAPFPDPEIYVLVIDHGRDRDVTVHASQEEAESAAAGYARAHWEDIVWQAGIPDSPDRLEDIMAVRLYFESAQLAGASCSISPAAPPRPEVNPELGRDQAANRAARFLPARDEDEQPAIDLAGALVIAWARDGELNVNIGLESADPGVYRTVGEEQRITVRVMITGDEIACADASPLGGELIPAAAPGAGSPAAPGRNHQERRARSGSPHAPGGPRNAR